MASNWALFNTLCRIIGGQDHTALAECLRAHQLSALIHMAAAQDVLPALAVRCYSQPDLAGSIPDKEDRLLRDALLENTRRNMHIVVQSINLVRTLNSAGITPLLLKGTALLLTTNREQPGFRKQADIDFIVEQESLTAASDALLAAGYGFYQEGQVFDTALRRIGDTQMAIRASASHHHLPPLVRSNQVAFVELHRHFLPRRFQHNTRLEPLFATANECQIEDAHFLTPSTEYQVIHLILGKFVHDGYLARRAFPIREAADYIALIDSVQNKFNSLMVEQQCGKPFSIFAQLVSKLMCREPAQPLQKCVNIERRLRAMQLRCDFTTPAKLLDGYARAEYLACAMLHSPEKLPAYLRRQ